MPEYFGLFSTMLSLLVLVAIVIGIISIARHGEGEDEPGIGTVRRLVLYVLAFGAAMLAATGISLLVGGLFDAFAGDILISESDTELAIGLSLSIVGGAAWGILWRVAASTIAHHPGERGSVSRHVYFTAVRGVAIAVLMVSTSRVLFWLFGVDDFDGTSVGFTLVWKALWLVHWRMAESDRPTSTAAQSLAHLYLFAAAFAGLAVLAISTGTLLAEYLGNAYDHAYGRALTGVTGLAITLPERRAAAFAVVGAAVWIWHWWRARRDATSTVWRIYVFLGGLLGGMTTAIVAASVALHRVLQWYFGRPSAATGVAHFDVLPGAFAALAVGLLLWGYHRAVLAEHARAAAAPPSETERVYRYLAAAAGLVTLVIGLARVLATASDLLGREGGTLLGGQDWWQNQLVLGATLLAVGVPLWLRYWLSVEAHAARGGPGELAALSRRIFLYGVFGVAGVTTLISLSIVLFEVFQGLLDGTLSTGVLHNARWSIAILLAAAGVSVYYWQVLRTDQQAQPPPAARPRRFIEVTVLNGDDGGALARRIEDRLGPRVRVRAWTRADIPPATPTVAALDELTRQIEATEGERVLVVIAPGGGGAVIPYATG
jgi:uncharacterized membrane protein YsdA (DUF1294 family)